MWFLAQSTCRFHAVRLRMQSGPRSLQEYMTRLRERCVRAERLENRHRSTTAWWNELHCLIKVVSCEWPFPAQIPRTSWVLRQRSSPWRSGELSSHDHSAHSRGERRTRCTLCDKSLSLPARCPVTLKCFSSVAKHTGSPTDLHCATGFNHARVVEMLIGLTTWTKTTCDHIRIHTSEELRRVSTRR